MEPMHEPYKGKYDMIFVVVLCWVYHAYFFNALVSRALPCGARK